jgi:hypothetical protein
MMWVYFIQSGPRGAIKIGTAGNPKKRVKALQIGNPARLALMATVPGGLELERELHARFARGHIADEWFAADTPGLIETVEHILRHGALPDLPCGDDAIGARCEKCLWPMEVELAERGERRCWTCMSEAAR